MAVQPQEAIKPLSVLELNTRIRCGAGTCGSPSRTQPRPSVR